MNSEKVKLVAFDLGYTLVYGNREEGYQTFLKQKGIDIPLEKIEIAYHIVDKLFMREYQGVFGRHPRTYMPWYLGQVNYQLNQQFDLFEQYDFLMNLPGEKHFWNLFPHTVDVLEELKKQGYQIALLSNWDLGCRDLLQELEIYDYFDYVLVSAEVGVEKPDKKIFELLLEETGLDSDEIVYVGDNYYDDVIGSRKVGIETILLNRFGRIGIEEINDCTVVPSTEALLDLLIERNEEKVQLKGRL